MKTQHSKIPLLLWNPGWIVLIAFLFSGCTDDQRSSQISERSRIVSAPSSIQLDLLPAGELQATFQIDDQPPVNMQVTGLNATLTINQLSVGEHTFTIKWYYDSDDFGLVALAQAIKVLNLVEGNNTLSFVDADYNTDQVDSNNNGTSNLAELEAGTNPLIGVCVFDQPTSLFGNCNFENS